MNSCRYCPRSTIPIINRLPNTIKKSDYHNCWYYKPISNFNYLTYGSYAARNRSF